MSPIDQAIADLHAIDPTLRTAVAGKLRALAKATRDTDRTRAQGLDDAADILDKRGWGWP